MDFSLAFKKFHQVCSHTQLQEVSRSTLNLAKFSKPQTCTQASNIADTTSLALLRKWNVIQVMY
jgi:hypothetical protein